MLAAKAWRAEFESPTLLQEPVRDILHPNYKSLQLGRRNNQHMWTLTQRLSENWFAWWCAPVTPTPERVRLEDHHLRGWGRRMTSVRPMGKLILKIKIKTSNKTKKTELPGKDFKAVIIKCFQAHLQRWFNGKSPWRKKRLSKDTEDTEEKAGHLRAWKHNKENRKCIDQIHYQKRDAWGKDHQTKMGRVCFVFVFVTTPSEQ